MIRALALAAICALSGCSALLPSTQTVQPGSWASYGEAQKTFDAIQLRRTTQADLKLLNIDPYASANVAILNYNDVSRRFLPDTGAVTLGDLDPNIQLCLKVKTACTAWQVHQEWRDTQHTGNFFLELFGFKQKTDTRGWSFDGLLLMHDDVVIYKLAGGQPSIREHEEKSNPLGPLGGIVRKFFGFFF